MITYWNLSDQHTYLGVSIHKHLSWTPHIVAKTSKTLKRNLSNTSRQLTYLTMVRSQLEYASDVWDPYQVEDITELDKVQQRAACWVLNDYGALYHQISLTIPPYFYQCHDLRDSTTHPLHYILPTTAYQYSYFYRTINDWNKLPLNLVEFTDTDSFINELQLLL